MLESIFHFLERFRPKAQDREFHELRGTIVALWAGLETGIDQANWAGWTVTDRKVAKVVPMAFRWKIQTFKKLHLDFLPFTDLRVTAENVFTRMTALVEDRHFLVHGVYSPNSQEGWTVRRYISQVDGGIEMVARRFTRAELKAMIRDLGQLTAQMT